MSVYYYKVDITQWARFIKPRTGIIDGFLVQPDIFCQANPDFGAKLSNCLAIMAKNTCVYGCRLVLYHSKFNISSRDWPKIYVCVHVDWWYIMFMGKVDEDWDGNHRCIASPTSLFYTKLVPMMEQNWVIVLLFWPKTHVCIVIECCYTISKSILVHEKGSWRIRWKSEMDF